MKKSVYSLVLQDDVVEAVDQMAYSRGMNRSGLVNQILAEYASLVTPEKRAGEIFDQVCLMLTPQSHFKILGRPSQKALNISSTLRYKYNPTLRYSVELHRGEDRTAGQLKVSVRSQNAALVQLIEAFFFICGTPWSRNTFRHGKEPSGRFHSKREVYPKPVSSC